LADYYFDGIAAGGSYSAAGLWLGSIAYSLQLYFDFSGYSDMAIGIGAMLGVSIPENFSQPYLASSISDFWRRWHKSLTSWFRDYIYIPLGGNRVSIAKHLRNMLIVWLITGIWHGANWTFVVWGLGYFVLLVLEKYLPIHGHGAEKHVPIHGHGAEKHVPRHGNGSIWSVLGHVYALFFVNLLWVLFRAKDLACAGVYLRGMFTLQGIAPEAFALRFAPFLCACIALIPIGALVSRKQEKSGAFIASEAAAQASLNKAWFVTEILRTIVLMLLFVFCAAAVMNSAYTPFIYGNF
ncbi:MAG: hypothetical protein K6G23_03630, partial [Lachnospiraceae bacterium]|nr:hypothetical protein [Lachnospiraceae bacterium]